VATGASTKVESSIELLARELFATVAQRLAEDFGAVTATVMDALDEADVPVEPAPCDDEIPSLYRPSQMRRRLDQLIESHRRYGYPFGIAVFDVEGPGTRNGEGEEAAPAVVGAALRDSVRLVDEVFHLEENAFCVLAPNQDTVGGVQMTERLLRMLDELEAAGGLKVTVSAGVVACPEHGAEASELLRKADEAMWRARAVGQPVGVGALGSLQDR
jgi:diguanylate cyclase (GGDEF)-like protein